MALEMEALGLDAMALLEDTDGSNSDVDSVLDAVGLLRPSDLDACMLEPDSPLGGLVLADQWALAGDDWTRKRPSDAKDRKPSKKTKVAKDAKLAAAAASPQPLRMRTYTARKNEIERLTAELPQLEAYVDYLKQQAVRQSGRQSSTDKQRLVNSKLREFAHHQHFSVARMQSAMSRYASQQSQMLPLDRAIYLPKDIGGRAKVLSGLRSRVLRDARAYMKERTAYLDLDTLPIHEQSSFMMPEGHACASDLAVVRLEGTTSVKAVYDATRVMLSKQDEIFSEVIGDCTVCEALDVVPDLQKRGITHHRLVCSAPGGLLVESNAVFYGEYRPHEGGVGEDGSNETPEHATIVLHTVEKDELHPYLTDQQLRMDVTSILSIQTRRRLPDARTASSSGSDSKEEVVIVRSSFVKLHRTELAVSPAEMRLTRDRLMQQGSVLVESVANLLARQA